jgi:muconate cycloisomerase
MQITGVEPIVIRMPPRREHRWSGNVTPVGTYLIVRLNTDEGLTGLGEAPTLAEWGGDYGRYYGETPSTAAHVISEYLVPAIIGMSPFDIGAIHERFDQVLKGHQFARAAIDIACFDLMGKATGLPAHAFLGGQHRSTIAIAHSFGSNLTPEAAGEEAQQALADGIRYFKVKVTDDGPRNADVLRSLRTAAGDELEIHVDANAAWRDPKTALREIDRLSEFGIAWVEQPCRNAEQLARVREATATPIMADESAWTARDVYELYRDRAVDLVSIYTTKAGGLHSALGVAAMCEIAGFPANLNGSAETGVGNAANLHFAAAARMAFLPCVLLINAPEGREQTVVGGRYYTDDIITEPFGYADGCLAVPSGPGLGVELDEDKIAKYRVELR